MDRREIKTDEESVFRLCNSLNAVAGALRCSRADHRLAELLLNAQATITVLYGELQALRKEKEGDV